MSNDPNDLFDPRALMGGDEGATEMVIFSHKGRVIQRFREPRLWLAYDPANAAELANKLLNCAKDCGAQVVLNLPRRRISKEKRDALVTRAIHVYRSMTEQKKPPAIVATHVVDSILSAID